MKKKLTVVDVRHVAKLANLPITDKELQKFTKQLSEVIDYNIGLLDKIPTEEVEPMAHVTGSKNILREDEVEPGLTDGEALANAKEEYNNFFKVKAILDK